MSKVSAEFKRGMLRKISREIYHLDEYDFQKMMVAVQNIYADKTAYNEESEDRMEMAFFTDEKAEGG